MGTRYFTPNEANEVLPAVRRLAEAMVEHRLLLLPAQKRLGELETRIGGNGQLQPGELAAAQEAVEREAAGVARCVEAIHELGAIVKDLDRGLVDFPARRGDDDVLLCWQLGEEEIAYWHGPEEGFAGRRSLPF